MKKDMMHSLKELWNIYEQGNNVFTRAVEWLPL